MSMSRDIGTVTPNFDDVGWIVWLLLDRYVGTATVEVGTERTTGVTRMPVSGFDLVLLCGHLLWGVSNWGLQQRTR